jgi:RNase P/RNase MRP subunit p29
MTTIIRGVLAGFSLASVFTVLSVATAAGQQTQTTTERIKGTPTSTTEQIHGTVKYVEGNDLVVAMPTGDIREFRVPDTRKFTIDGKEVSVHQLKPGTQLTATVTTTTTPVTERTVTVGSGKVFFVQGNTVVITANGENKVYTVDDSYRFTVDGKPAGVHALRKGMNVSGEKIVEAPHTEIAKDTVVTGTSK